MNHRANSGYNYSATDLCRLAICKRKAPYGCRGLCEHHYNIRKVQLMNAGQMLGRGRVPAGPVAERIAILKGAGLTPSHIAHLSGVSAMTLWRILKQDMVNADTAARIMRIQF